MRAVAVAAALILNGCAVPPAPTTTLVGRYTDSLVARDTPNWRGVVALQSVARRNTGMSTG